jgi:hypothetical protein
VLEDGKPVCQTLRCIRRPGGPPVTGEGIRKIPVAGILRHTLPDVALRITETGPGQYVLTPILPGGEASEDQMMAAVREAMAVAPKRYPVTEARLKKAALLYSDAEARGDPPTKHVATSMTVSRATASRLIREARNRGYLPERQR